MINVTSPPLPVVIVVLAAGSSTRMGEPKQLSHYRGTSLLRHVAGQAAGSKASSTLVVVGADPQRMTAELVGLPVAVIENRAWQYGLSSSILAGVAAAPPDASLLFLVCDQPLVTTELINNIIDVAASAPDSFVACEYAGTLGVPALFPPSCRNELQALRGDTGAKTILQRNHAHVLRIPFPGGDSDIDTPRDQQQVHTPRAVIFDFGNVICTFDVDRLVRNLAGTSGQIPEVIRRGIQDSVPLILQFETGLVSPEEFFRGMSGTMAIAVPPNVFREAYCNIFEPVPLVFDLVRALKGHYTLGLLSNTNTWHFECAIRTVEIFPLFDAVTLSFQVNAMKPSEAIYRDMLQKLGIPPEQCVYIDDLRENVEAAAGLGMQAIHCQDHTALPAALARHGVQVPGIPPSERFLFTDPESV